MRWHPVEHMETACIEPLDLAADPVTGALFLFGRDRDHGLRLLRTEDRRRWATVEVPFPDGWEPGVESVRGDTLVITGGREHATGSIDGPEDSDWRAEPLISRDGGATWAISSGWPALMDGMTRVVIGDGIIVAGAEFPTSAIFLKSP